MTTIPNLVMDVQPTVLNMKEALFVLQRVVLVKLFVVIPRFLVPKLVMMETSCPGMAAALSVG